MCAVCLEKLARAFAVALVPYIKVNSQKFSRTRPDDECYVEQLYNKTRDKIARARICHVFVVRIHIRIGAVIEATHTHWEISICLAYDYHVILSNAIEMPILHIFA